MHFMTPEQLDLSPEEHSGLIELIEHFRGAVCQVPSNTMDGVHRYKDKIQCETIETVLGFSMSYGAGLPDIRNVSPSVIAKYDCGCVACIGGHLSLKMQGADITKRVFTGEQLIEADRYVMRVDNDKPVHDLFFPDHVDLRNDSWDVITPAIAAEAIENFLTTGRPDWAGLSVKHDLAKDSYEDGDEE